MAGDPYSEACYAAADTLEEKNDTFETMIDWLSEDTGLGEKEKELYQNHQNIYSKAERFRAIIYTKLNEAEIDEIPSHMAILEKEIGRAKDLMDRYREEN